MQCPICFVEDISNSPRITLCQNNHFVCLQCHANMQFHNKEEFQRCPICREQCHIGVQQINHIPQQPNAENFVLLQLTDKIFSLAHTQTTGWRMTRTYYIKIQLLGNIKPKAYHIQQIIMSGLEDLITKITEMPSLLHKQVYGRYYGFFDEVINGDIQLKLCSSNSRKFRNPFDNRIASQFIM